MVKLVTRIDGVKLGVIRHNSVCVLESAGGNDVEDGMVAGVRGRVDVWPL